MDGEQGTDVTDEAGAMGEPEGGGVAPDPEGSDTIDGVSDDVELVRSFVLRHDAALVPELVAGGSVAELLASVATARAAYARIAEQVRRAPPSAPVSQAVPVVPVVPAGGVAAFTVDPSTLPAGEMIRRGVTAARRG